MILGAAEAGLDFVEIPLLDPAAMDVEREVIGDPDALVRDGLAFLRAKGREHGVLG